MSRGIFSSCLRAALVILFLLLPWAAEAGAGKVETNGEIELNLHFRFLPTAVDIARVQEQFRRTSQMLCDATEGQMRIRKVRLSAGGSSEPAGDFWYYGPGALPRSSSNGAPVNNPGVRIYLGYEAIRADVVTHELGHQVFGLGDQYEEQRRFGGACGIGPSFDIAAPVVQGACRFGLSGNEQDHTIMQQASYQQCVSGGAPTGQTCYDDADCPAGQTCPLSPLMSEFSVASNFDSRRGDGVLPVDTCPGVRSGDTFTLTGQLDPASSVTALDTSSFEKAEATAAIWMPYDFIDSIGKVESWGKDSAHTVRVYAERTGAHAWKLHFGLDEGELSGGTAKKLKILKTVTADFTAAGALQTVDGTAISDPGYKDPVLEIKDFANGAANAALKIRFDNFQEVGNNWIGCSWIHSAGNQQLGICGETKGCHQRWDTGTQRWEATAVTVGALQAGTAPLSDWEQLVINLKAWYALNLTAPATFPVIAAPASCAGSENVTFDVAVQGADQVFLVIDRSGSMKADREDLGDTRTRLDWAKAGARAFLELTKGSGVEAGLISFSDTANQELGLAKIEEDAAVLAGDHKLSDFRTRVDNLAPDGNTAIGDALALARTGLDTAKLADPAKNQAVFLLSDGENNSGSNDPLAVAQKMRDDGIQVFTLPVGNAADGESLSKIADETGGVMFSSAQGLELPTLYAELYARFRGEVPVLARTLSAVRGRASSLPVIKSLPPGLPAAGDSPLPEEETFVIPVEAGAEKLNVTLSARNLSASSWSPGFALITPSGATWPLGPGAVSTDPYYRILRVQSPMAGDWKLRIFAQSPDDQLSYLLAHVENPGPDCYAGASPHVVTSAAGGVEIVATSSFGAPLGQGVQYTARVWRPDGSSVAVPLALTPDQTGARGRFTSFLGRGRYEVVVECRVPAGTRFAPGEHSTLSDVLAQGDPTPFTRQVRADFFADLSDYPPFPPGGDCNHDGVPDEVAGTFDFDGDGVPNACDDDADGDDTPDVHEGTGGPGSGHPGQPGNENPRGDCDHDGRMNFLDTDSDNDLIPDGRDPEPCRPGGIFALKPRRFSFHVGSAHPLRDSSSADANIYVQGDAVLFQLSDNLELKAMLGLAQLTAETAAAIEHPRWIHASLDAQLLFPTASGLDRYLQAGPGLYRSKSGNYDAGLNLGLGARIPLQIPFALEFGADYHRILDQEHSEFLTLHLGVLFR